MTQDCIFCKIKAGEIPGETLHSDEHCFVIRDIAPKAPVHLLIIPNEHFTYLTGVGPTFFATLGSMFTVAQEMAARENVLESGYRLIINQGADSGQQVDHLHLHLLGGKALGDMG